MSTSLIRAAFVAPMDGPLIRNGAVLIHSGRITAVGDYPTLRHHTAQIHDAGNAILLPGLINAHTHLELSDCTPGERPTNGLEGWLQRMLARTRLDPDELEDRSIQGVRHGIAQCLRFGVTTVGDISRQCHVTRPILQASPLRAVSFGEVMAMAQRRAWLESRLELAADTQFATDRLRIGISPHSPYSIEPEGFRRCLESARQGNLPLATHLAETRSEWEFLAHHSGPLKQLWDSWLTWDDLVPRYPLGPIHLAHDLGLLSYPTLLAHVNYCDDEELSLLAAGQASVVYCPRTHDYFNHPPHRFRDMLNAGVNVALGTDSCASSPDLNLLDDLRLLHQQYPDLDVHLLWKMATLNAAKALCWQTGIGSLTPGKHADLVAFPISANDPLRELLETPILPSALWLAGHRSQLSSCT